jgi:tripartite-type tricarboxylate transporter receptor subunit TctC
MTHAAGSAAPARERLRSGKPCRLNALPDRRSRGASEIACGTDCVRQSAAGAAYGRFIGWGSSHLRMQSFNGMVGLSLLRVPYKGSSLAMNDIVAGHVHVYCPGAPGAPAFAQTGKLRTLGVTYQKPTPLAPGVPPVADTLPGFELLGWYGIEAAAADPEVPHCTHQRRDRESPQNARTAGAARQSRCRGGGLIAR